MRAPKARVSVRLTPDDIEAIGFALDLAYGDQNHYLVYSDPDKDYGAEWPEASRRKQEQFRRLAAIAKKLGLNGEPARWRNLAKKVKAIK